MLIFPTGSELVVSTVRTKGMRIENEIKFTNDTSICRRVFLSFIILDKVSFSVCGLSFLGCQGMLFTRNGRSRVKYLSVSHPVKFVFSNCPN